MDNASGHIFIHHQVSLVADESIEAKYVYDREAALSLFPNYTNQGFSRQNNASYTGEAKKKMS